MPIAKVHRISAAAPDDVSGIEAAIAAGRLDPNGVIAVLGKTEGNGLVNDFARGYASLALSLLFQRHLPKPVADKICLVMSGGTEGGMAPHWTVFERAEDTGAPGPALAIGRAHTDALAAERLGRLAQVEAVAAGVRAAMADAGISDPGDVHFVQVKCPLLTVARTAEAEARGASVATKDTLKSMGLSRAASALGVAAALAEIQASNLREADIAVRWDLYSGRASCSAGVELLGHEIVVFGMSRTWSGPLAIDHAVMQDAIDIEPVRAALARLGLSMARPAFGCSAQPSGRGSRQGRGQPRWPVARPSSHHAGRFRHLLNPARPRLRLRCTGRIGRSCGDLCVRRRRTPGTGRRRTGGADRNKGC